jgi:trimethylamine--corrinoid protein Co-methyltransferase
MSGDPSPPGTGEAARVTDVAARRRGRREHLDRERRAADRDAQVPWRRLTNPFRPLEPLSTDQVESLHEAGLRILRDIGVEVIGDRALDLLVEAGANVDRATRRVRLDPAHVDGLRATAPATFTIHARNPERDVGLGGSEVVFCAVGGPAFVSDLDRGRRAGNHRDLADYVRLIGALNVLHQEGGGPLEPTDLPVPTRHLDMYRMFIGLLDKTWHCLGAGRVVVDDAIEMVCLARGIDRDQLAREPSLLTVINTNSPLRLDGPMSEGLIEMARAGQGVVATPFTLAGAMSPVTLAGALAQQHAEALFMVALTQLVRPGAPVVYGAFTSNVDMRTGAPAFGTPESTKAQLASGQLARRVGLPWRSSNATASNTVDAQAAYEAAMSSWGALMGGVHLLYQGAGWLEGGLTASYEKLILDAEILQMLSEVVQPIEVSETTLGLGAIAEVGPGGHFFGVGHTLDRFRDAFYRPLLSDWRNFETWQADGARTATERANAIWKSLLAAYEPPPLEPGIGEALDAFVERRKREISTG